MKDDPIVTSSQELTIVLEGIGFAPSCLNLGWQWEVNAIYGKRFEEGYDPYVIGWLLRATFMRPDTTTGLPGRGHGRWEFVAMNTSESGVVKTAWLLVELVVRHELMEAFLYQGVRIFDPHKTVADLAWGAR